VTVDGALLPNRSKTTTNSYEKKTQLIGEKR